MGIFSAISDWVQEQFKKITDWIRNVLAKALDDLRVWIALRVHDFKAWLADFVSTTGGFWITVAVVIGAVVLGAYIGQTAWFTSAVATINTTIDSIKMGTGNILAHLGYSIVNATHNVLLVLNDDYKAAWQVFYKSLSSLSDELRLGVSTINVALRGARTVCYSAMIFAGFSENDATAWFADNSSTFMSKLEDRFERYTRSPELIFQDIDDELVGPMIELMQGGAQEVLGDIAGAYQMISEKATQLATLKGSFDDFVNGFPDEIAKAMNLTWSKVSEGFDDFYDSYVAPVQKAGDAIAAEVEDFIDSQNEKIKELVEKYESPGDMLAATLLLPEPFRTQQLKRIYDIFNYAGYYDSLDAAQAAIDDANRNHEKVDNLLARLDRVYKPRFTVPKGITIAHQQATFDVWYVGGY